MRSLLVLLALLLSSPVLAQSALPPAPYADRQISDPALERKADIAAFLTGLEPLPDMPEPIDRRQQCKHGG